MASILGQLPTHEEYLSYASELDTLNAEIYRYLNFNEIESFQKSADSAVIPTVNIVNAT